ncbi:hypothetical protein C8A03DRAFT_40429 [Achaetomium macrosporum]|uniref:Heterokaryon incompatibility domain-containing protein n=1 Tax=Achaetomium macrosporum TaxID=79813 RepID=A0AAN7HEL8_9PEZI|nr:hypothetical protein C8A03DRAFT_40429 [Achaetomium macrosporum]
MVCARCREVLQCIVSDDDTQTTGSDTVEGQQLRGDQSHKPDEWPGITHHPTYRSLKEAVAQRRSLCIAVWEMLPPKNRSFAMQVSSPHKGSTSSTLEEGCTKFDCTRITIPMPRLTQPDASIHPVALTDNTRSPETLALAKRWVADCVRHHKRCNAISGDRPWYPTRLLDLCRISHGSTEPSPEQTVALIETAKVIPTGRFTTLSRRRDPTEQLRLTKRTYPQLAEGLGICYLWIDLLCIYQDEDDITDWQREFALMNKVYSNTLWAGDANGCLESMFSPRDQITFLPQLIELKIGDREDETGLFRVYDLNYWRRSVPRALECLEQAARETWPEHIPSLLMGWCQLLFKSLVPSFSADVRHTWTFLVKEYTACLLTVPSDSLIAISGIAKHVAALQQDDYVAGTWRSHLEGELRWFVDRSDLGNPTRPPNHSAHSWSWGAIDGPYQTGDIFGAVTGGCLRLRGPFRQLQLVTNTLDPNHPYQWDIILEGINVAWPDTRPWHRVDVRLDTFYDDCATCMLLAMLAANYKHEENAEINRRDPSPWDGDMDILLLKLVDREKAIFERISHANSWLSALKEAILKIQRPKDVPPLPYPSATDKIMPFNFSFSSSASAVVVGSASANGHGATKGWAYKHEAYSNNDGSGVRTTKQKLGEPPVTQTRMYDAQGRPLLTDGADRRTGLDDSVRRIEDVTEDRPSTGSVKVAEN